MTTEEKIKDQMDKVQAQTVGHLVKNMTKREQREAVKGCSTDILMDEIARRSELMTKQLAEARKVLRV